MLSFWLFVVGGLAFGSIFLDNWRGLSTPRETVAGEPAVAILPSIPQINMPGSSSPPASAPTRAAGAPRPAGPSSPSNPAVGALISLLPQWSGTERINILLLGVDRRESGTMDGTRTDTIMLASIDPVQKSVAMVSLPRDLWVHIPGYGEQRINVAHAVGGPEAAKQTVSANFGFPVQYFARVDFQGFEDLVAALGGIMVDVERPVKDDAYPTDDYGYQRIYVPAGPQLMNGQTALYYARSRHNTNDFDRAGRQQKVVVAMRDRALQLNMLPRAPQLIDIVTKAVSTDLSTTDILALARLASEIDSERIGSLVIDANYATPFRGADGADLLLPNGPAIRQAIEQKFQRASRPELRGRVEVLNGTDTVGLGQQVADRLTAQGYEVVRIDFADRRDYAQSSVQVLTGDRFPAENVASVLGIVATSVVDQPTLNANADTRVIIGSDYLSTAR